MQERVYGQGMDGHKHGFQDIKDVVLGRGLVRRAICVVEALQGPHHGCDDPLQLLDKCVGEDSPFVPLQGVHVVFKGACHFGHRNVGPGQLLAVPVF